MDDIWFDQNSCRLEDFQALVERTTTVDQAPRAAEITANIPIYDAGAIRRVLDDDAAVKSYLAEWNRILDKGAGIVAFRNAYADTSIVDQVTDVLSAIIAKEEDTLAGRGDHFAAPGANSRMWNAHEKLCRASPELFARYNANPVIALISRSWLGPYYQITTQVNVVRPGGVAQVCHRDYHMGFQDADTLTRYPAPVHRLSAFLTLQGGIAHSDMPLASGPTKLLPYSQTYLPGYLASLQPEFRDYFEDHYVQLPLSKGDAFFFNPAVFHAAGDNKTDHIHRFANLMQIGSGYGRSIETVDRVGMCRVLYPVLRDLQDAGQLSGAEVNFVIDACAEGYPFPTNLDIDSPLSGMAPPSQQDLMRRALSENWDDHVFIDALNEQTERRLSH